MPADNVPTFGSFEDLQKFLDKKAEKRQDKPKRSRNKPPKPDTTAPRDNKSIYRTIHIYTRPGDTFTQVLKDARSESEACGPDTILNCHDHNYGDTCVPTCREVQ